MGEINKPHGDFNAGDLIIASYINDQFNTLYNEINGNLDGYNIADGSLTPEKIKDEYRYDEFLKGMNNWVINGFTLSKADNAYSIGSGTAWILSEYTTSSGGSGELTSGEEAVIFCDNSGNIIKSSVLNQGNYANYLPLYFLKYEGTSITSYDLRMYSPMAIQQYRSSQAISSLPYNSPVFAFWLTPYSNINIHAMITGNATSSGTLKCTIYGRDTYSSTDYLTIINVYNSVTGYFVFPVIFSILGSYSSVYLTYVSVTLSSGAEPTDMACRLFMNTIRR